MIWILCLLLSWNPYNLLSVWKPQPYNWYLCNKGKYYDTYTMAEWQCKNGMVRIMGETTVKILPKLGFMDCLSGPNASANDVCVYFYDKDYDGSITLRDVSIWLK